jgi:DNA-binding Xre family transcriptional regulator
VGALFQLLELGMPPHRFMGSQARAARAMLDWSVRQLAHHSGISDSSIRRIESVSGVPDNVTLDLLEKLQAYFETKGFKFVWSEEAGPGLHWRRPGRSERRNRRAGDPALGRAELTRTNPDSRLLTALLTDCLRAAAPQG